MNHKISRKRFIKTLGGGVALAAFSFKPQKMSFAVSDAVSGQEAVSGNPKVIRAYDPAATFWSYRDSEYLDYIRQDVVNEMVERGVLKLTGEENLADAWKRLIPDYANGDGIAIKPNFNNIHLGPQGLITCPQLIGSVVSHLVDVRRVPASDIYVYDLCKRIPQAMVKDRIGYQINYVERRQDGFMEGKIAPRLGWGLESADKSAAIEMSAFLQDAGGAPVACFIPKVLTRCKHLINIALLSNHPFLAISGPLKNHFGTVRFSNYQSYPVALHGEVLQKSIVDINMNPHIRRKTRLVMCDALFGQFGRGDTGFVERWETFPTDNGTPNSVFFAADPVALESVLLHLVNREREARGLLIRSHDYLHIAARKGLGIHEDVANLRELETISYETV